MDSLIFKLVSTLDLLLFHLLQVLGHLLRKFLENLNIVDIGQDLLDATPEYGLLRIYLCQTIHEFRIIRKYARVEMLVK